MDVEWRLRAENELNETTDKYETEKEAMRDLVLSILYSQFSCWTIDFIKKSFSEDPNLSVPNNHEFLIRFLRARKFNSLKAFQMVCELTSINHHQIVLFFCYRCKDIT